MIILVILSIIFSLFFIYLIWDNFRITIREVNIKVWENERVNNSENKKEDNERTKVRILHLSDFHNREWPNENRYFIDKVRELKPEYIFITGDLIDHRVVQLTVVEKLLDELNEIVGNTKEDNKIIYVYGNHEKTIGYEFMLNYEKMLKEKNVLLLKNEVKEIYLNDTKINVLGMDDPRNELVEILTRDSDTIGISVMDFVVKDNDSAKENLKIIDQSLRKIFRGNSEKLKSGYNILLSHRPEGFKIYQEYDIDLVLTGHAHGGQGRIPFTNISVIAPNQGLFPKHTKGVFKERSTIMNVSAGVGNSLIPIRVFNPSELVIIELEI